MLYESNTVEYDYDRTLGRPSNRAAGTKYGVNSYISWIGRGRYRVANWL